MINETHYGVFSDVHQDPRIVPVAIEVLKKLGAEKLLINGDIGNRQKSFKDNQNYIGFILESIGESGLESYVQPGSHETLLAFSPVMNFLEENYSNLIDVTKNPKIEHKGHSLIFLPGSDYLCGGEYQIGNNEQISTGTYILGEEGIMSIDLETYMDVMRSGRAQELELGTIKGIMSYQNMNDLKKLVTNPDKSIVVCHVPRKFDNLEYAVDVAEFGITEYGFHEYSVTDGKNDFRVIENYGDDHYKFLNKLKEANLKIKNINAIHDGSIFPLESANYFNKLGANIEIRRENRGNDDLKSLYEELGITKAVSGHFHESGHRANDSSGNYVAPGNLVNDLFWNSGHLDAGQTGILTVGDGKVSYRNINLEEFLR